MERIQEEYAAYLHQSRLHPYTQHLEMREKEWYWVICTLNETAAQHILRDTLLNLDSLDLRKRQLQINITGRNYSEKKQKDLTDYFYQVPSKRYIELHFLTPTAFKRNGAYLFYPDIHCLYQSLMNKYDAAITDESVIDEDVLAHLCENTQITRYDLKSVYFYLEKVRIPAFIGKITLKLSGTQTIADFAHLLFEFGTYAGVGIKTALGMGAYRILGNEVI